MKPPNQKTCTIGEMLEWAATNNGKVKASIQEIINDVLADIQELNLIKFAKFHQRKWIKEAIDRVKFLPHLKRLQIVDVRAPHIHSKDKYRLKIACDYLGYDLHHNGYRFFTMPKKAATFTKPC